MSDEGIERDAQELVWDLVIGVLRDGDNTMFGAAIMAADRELLQYALACAAGRFVGCIQGLSKIEGEMNPLEYALWLKED